MQLFPVLLVVAVVLADNGLVVHAGPPEAGTVAGLTLLPMALVVAAGGLLLRGCRKDLGRLGPRAVVRAARITTAARALVLIVHAAALLGLGWLSAVRAAVGDGILIDEVLAIVPAALAWLAIWWLHYPIERRLRDALLVRRMDQGQPIHLTPSRSAYVALQARSGLLLILLPILIIVGMVEVIDAVARRVEGAPVWALDLARLAAALLVFTLSPLLARAVLSVRSLEPGDLRDRLVEICRRHGVAVRDILIWHTSGTIINAAVMGVAASLRYVLLTDALLESMSDREVEAVMAHEVAHVRWRHVPWLVVCLLAAVASSVLATDLLLWAADAGGLLGAAGGAGAGRAGGIEMAVHLLELALALLAFGWVSRRFERQADTFAVQHLSGLRGGEEAPIMSDEAVATMRGALSRIAELNGIDPCRRSWRHGSIAWRQRYLASLAGRSIERPPIDRIVRVLKVIAGLIVLAAIVLQVALDLSGAAAPEVLP